MSGIASHRFRRQGSSSSSVGRKTPRRTPQRAQRKRTRSRHTVRGSKRTLLGSLGSRLRARPQTARRRQTRGTEAARTRSCQTRGSLERDHRNTRRTQRHPSLTAQPCRSRRREGASRERLPPRFRLDRPCTGPRWAGRAPQAQVRWPPRRGCLVAGSAFLEGGERGKVLRVATKTRSSSSGRDTR